MASKKKSPFKVVNDYNRQVHAVEQAFSMVSERTTSIMQVQDQAIFISELEEQVRKLKDIVIKASR